jgi:hypothetical protein
MFYKRKNYPEVKEILYSKLATNQWPAVSHILAKIHRTLP